MTENALTTDQMLLVMELAGLEYREGSGLYYPCMQKDNSYYYVHVCDSDSSAETVRARGRDFIIKELFQAFIDGRGRTSDREKDV